MIITYPKINPDGAEITKAIMDNKVLLYSVIVHDEHIIAEGRLVSIRQMLDAFKDDPPKTVDELVMRYGDVFYEEEYSRQDRELVEAVFDQKTGAKRSFDLTELSNESEGTTSAFAYFGMSIVDSFLKKLPETTPYGDELAFV